jgi:glutathione S-transferase
VVLKEREDMIKLHQGTRLLKLPNASPPCVKLETWLRMTGIPYESAPPDLAEAPKGKIPFIEDNGVTIGDSTLIIEHLKRTYEKDPDAGLRPEERAISLAFRRMLKENTYWVFIHALYVDPRTSPVWKEILAQLVTDLGINSRDVFEGWYGQYVANYKAQLNGHGMGRHASEEVYQLGVADLTAVADFLGDKPFFMGETPTTADATVYAHTTTLLELPLETPVRAYGLRRDNLVRYCQRMRERFYPELV